jgi:hypothetical protein
MDACTSQLCICLPVPNDPAVIAALLAILLPPATPPPSAQPPAAPVKK